MCSSVTVQADHKQLILPKGLWFYWKAGSNHQNLISKCAKDGADPYLALLQLRSTPLDSRIPSPGELLQNRQLRTALSVIIRPPAYSEAVKAALQSRQVHTNHDVHAKKLSKFLLTQPVWVQITLTKKWEKGVIKSQAETPRSYIVITRQGEKRRNRIPLREAGISTNTATMAPNVEKVEICVICAPNKSPSVKSVFQPNETKVSQSVVENVPKANVQCVLRPMVKLVPKTNVQDVYSSGMNSTLNSAGKEIAHNQSENSVPKLVVRKNQGIVLKDGKCMPTAPPGIGDNNKIIPKVSTSTPPTLNPVFRWIIAFWNSKSSYQSDIHTVWPLCSS